MFKARSHMINCIKEIERLDRENRKQYLLYKFRVRITSMKSGICLAGHGDIMHVVCKRGFCHAYAVSHWHVEDLVEKLKREMSLYFRLETFTGCFGIPSPIVFPSS